MAINSAGINVTNLSTYKYVDVPSTHSFQTYIAYADQNKLIAGTTTNRFSPDRPITRIEAITILVKLKGVPLDRPMTSFFRDIGTSEFRLYTDTAYNLKIVNGFSDGTFRPYDNLTRGQAAKMIVNTFKL